MNKISTRSVKNILKSIYVLVAMTALVGSQILIIGIDSVQAQKDRQLAEQKRKTDAKKSEIRNGAMQYERAVGQLRMLSSRTFSSPKEVERALSTLKQNRRALDRGPYKSLVNSAINNSTFRRSVEAAAKREGYENLYRQIMRNPKMVMNFSGASQLKSTLRSQLGAQVGYFRNLSAKLKNAKNKFGSEKSMYLRDYKTPATEREITRTVFSPESNVFFVKSNAWRDFTAADFPVRYTEREKAAFRIPAAIETALVAAAVVIIGAAAAAAAVLIKAYVDAKVEDFTDPDDGAGVSDYKLCTDKADAELDTCLGNSNFWWEETGCWAVYAARKADCLLLPQ